jgi:hypothetical protein
MLVKLLQRLFKAMSVYTETLSKDEENEHEWMKGSDNSRMVALASLLTLSFPSRIDEIE